MASCGVKHVVSLPSWTGSPCGSLRSGGACLFRLSASLPASLLLVHPTYLSASFILFVPSSPLDLSALLSIPQRLCTSSILPPRLAARSGLCTGSVVPLYIHVHPCSSLYSHGVSCTSFSCSRRPCGLPATAYQALMGPYPILGRL